ncbi:hypothetical protein HHK36_012359 [Tetracentron sinense]|uniref:Uncharacterized protein n=1 Tax=Tetracentron sinense TaxID=13715 RepID=A0A834Z6Q6_TETSI|nr:hypothetical protein HHK36_012359 [Tetracentron sinense]
METSVIADAVTAATTPGLGFAKFLLRRHYFTSNNHFSVPCDVSSESSSAAGVLSISAGVLPIDAIAPPAVRSNSYRAALRTLSRQKRRTRRRSLTGDFDDGEEDGFFGDGGDGPFGGGGYGGYGGRGWNFDGYGGSNWEDSSSSSSDPAFDFVYEVLSWIALSNCVHFAFKKVIRIVAGGIGDPSREKVPMRAVPIC